MGLTSIYPRARTSQGFQGGYITTLNHETFMKQALKLAEAAAQIGEVPVGALVVSPHGEILGAGHNLRETHQSAIGHAEIQAIQAANKNLGTWRLEGCTLYATLEPCPMCAGAIWASRIAKVVYGAKDPKAGYCDSLHQLGQNQQLNHRFEVLGGVLEKECALILKDFFQKLRALKS